MGRHRVAFAALILGAASASLALGGCGSRSNENLDSTGILLVNPGEVVQPRPNGQEAEVALSDAMQFADSNGADIGYPWIDPSNGELVVTAVTSRGRALIEQLGLTVPYQIRTGTHGVTELQSISDGATFLAEQGVPDAQLIDQTGPDPRDNRALIIIRSASRQLLDWLAAHYPPDALAVEVNPGGS